MYGSQVRCTYMAVRIGVHVWQLGQVLGQVRLGQVSWVRLGKVRCKCMALRLGVHVWQLGQVRLGQVRLGQVRLGQELGQVRQGSLGHEQVLQIKLLTISIGKKFTFSVFMLHQKEASIICHFFVNCLIPVEPGLTGFEQLINFVSSS